MARSIPVLTAYRWALGLFIAFDVAYRAAHGFSLFYTDAGALPWPLYSERYGDWTTWSLHGFAGQWFWAQAALFAAHGAAALAFAAGVKPALSWFLTLALTISLQHRNPYLQVGVDAYVVMALYWWPLISARNGRGGAGRFWLVQVAAVYGFAAAIKCGSMAWTEGTALELALRDGFYGNSFLARGLLGLGQPFLKLANYAVLVLEAGAPLALLASLKLKALRRPVVVVLILFHLGIAFTFDIWQLSIISILGLASLWTEQSGAPARGRNGPVFTAATLLALSLVLNAASLAPQLKTSQRLAHWSSAAGMAQQWAMFSTLSHGEIHYEVSDSSGLDQIPPWIHEDKRAIRYLSSLAKPQHRAFAARFTRLYCGGGAPLKFEVTGRAFGGTQDSRSLIHYESCGDL